MDRKLQQKQEIERLIQLSDSARSTLENAAITLTERLDVPSRLRSSLKSHPTGWLVGSLASGLAASMIFGRKAAVVEKKRRSFPGALLGLSLTAIRPFAKVWLTDQVTNYLAGTSPANRGRQSPKVTTQNPNSF
jgi:hypothetical protein